MKVSWRAQRRCFLACAAGIATAVLAGRAGARAAGPAMWLAGDDAEGSATGNLRAAVRADFATGRVVLVGGWVLSRTEAGLVETPPRVT